jgi:pimeloyl-ACP methyl ester carboxylesterase
MRATAPLNFFDLEAMRHFQRALRDIPAPRAQTFARTPAKPEEWIGRGLSSVVAPTLVVVGRFDFVTPIDAAVEVANAIAGTRLVVIDHAGHNPWAERPRAVAQAIRSFLDNVVEPDS